MHKQSRQCDDCHVQMALYLDGELDKYEQRMIDEHLQECRDCREAFNRERWFLEGLQRTAPLYIAPDKLRTKLRSVVDKAPATTMINRSESSWLARLHLMNKRVATMVASVLVVVGLWGMMQWLSPTQSMSFAALAVDTHQRHTLGRLPLELESDAPDQISSWFKGKVPFSLKLPNYQDASGQEKLYRLKGARLIGFKNDYAAYVAYQMAEHPISLVVTSSTNAKPAGGDTITVKDLRFHYETRAGFKVITWSHRGLTYALVSDLDEHGQQSCLVCHQGIKDKEFLDSLNLIGLVSTTIPAR